MNHTLKITSVLSDPTRFQIYQFINEQLEDITVQDVATKFNIHPNVARLHLSKLEEIHLIVSETRKTGKGGRPSKIYHLSEEVVQLHLPYRDYQLLAKIALETLLSFGAAGIKAFCEVGSKYGKEMIINLLFQRGKRLEDLNKDEKLTILKEACANLGFYSSFHAVDESTIEFDVKNCPFRELSIQNNSNVCTMHAFFLRSMVNTLFPEANVVELNHLSDCKHKTCNFKMDL